ncbi:MAG: SusC/RagA family TonB-linked outer membrane protein, partial [Bacteroidales bacterium]
MKKVLSYLFSLKGTLLPLGRIILVGIFLLFQLGALAQQRTISGTVRDNNNVPLAGVTVLLKGTTVGTITDANGRFTLNVPVSGGILVFTFVGMSEREVPIGASNTYDVVLTESVTALEEIVVVGYGAQKKESAVGAITQVGSASLQKTAAVNVTNALSGKLSGLFTNQRSGEPGLNAAEIIVRGLSSWNSSAPLVLVDGVERNFTNMDYNEIESISVLKDASATAVFGAKGANGVIIVTTKRGSLSKPNMDFSTSYGMTRVITIPKHIDSYTTMSVYNTALKNVQRFSDLIPDNILEEYRNPSTPLNSLRYPNNDWWRMLTQPFAPTYNANFNVQGGTNFAKYFASLGYYYEGTFFKQTKEGVMDNRFWFKRFNYRTNVDFLLSKSTTLSFNIGGELGIKNQPAMNQTIWKALVATGPSRFPAYFPEWVLEMVPDPDYPDDKGIRFSHKLGETDYNPYTLLHQGSFSRYVNSELFTDMIITQKLDFLLKGLSAKGKVSFSTTYLNLDLTASYNKPDYQLRYDLIGVEGANPWVRSGQGAEVWKMPPFSVSVGGLQTQYTVDRFVENSIDGFYNDLYYEGSLNYQNSFGKHNLSALALLNRQQKNRRTDFPYFYEAYVGRVTYNYALKYLFEVNAGYTGSERFAPNNRYGFFPSAAIGWVVSEEPFFKNAVPWMNRLKMRYSDGLVGSDAASERWLYISEYTLSGSYINEGSAANPYAQWEEARKRDIGIEIGIFNNLLSFTVDLFDEHRSKMLISPVVTYFVGNTFKDLNKGSLKKHGIEVEAEFNKTTPFGLNYFVKGMLALNENRVIVRNDPEYAPDYVKEAGKPLVARPLGDGTFTVMNCTHLLDDQYYQTVDDLHNHITASSFTY